MFKGFYNLTSGVLTNQRNLNVIANNMTNISTPGFKQERYTATTFDEVLYSRVGNKDSQGPEIGGQSYIRATSDIETDYAQGVLEPTELPLDFALNGEGFFAVQSQDGQISYTRGGSFSLDEEGYLCLPGFGRVLNPQGETIQLNTDKVHGDSQGVLHYEGEGGGILGQLGVFTFQNVEDLERTPQGLFTGNGAEAIQTTPVLSGYLERSNTDPVKQMTEMITFQRSLQGTAQVLKMYDNLMTKAANDVGRL